MILLSLKWHKKYKTFILEHILKKKLTVVDKFHSHFEPMKFLKPDTFSEQVSIIIMLYIMHIYILVL